MGILFNALSIVSGSLLGNRYKERIAFKNFCILGISIMIISLAGFVENVFSITDMKLESGNLTVVVFSFIIGSYIGDFLHIEGKLSSFAKYENKTCNALIDTTLFFGVGGLQITGPIMLAATGDSSLLILKSVIDFPFAVMFGMSYGKITSLSAIIVGAVQALTVIIAFLAEDFLSNTVIAQLCAMGYIILFFSGFNLVCDSSHKINNTSMIPGIFIIIIYNLFLSVWRIIV